LIAYNLSFVWKKGVTCASISRGLQRVGKCTFADRDSVRPCRMNLLEGAAVGGFTGFWFLARDSDQDAVASCIICSVVVFMLWMFVRIVMAKSSPAYSQLKSAPSASDLILSNIASRRSVYPKDLNGKIISKET
jgi:hypothetical protein